MRKAVVVIALVAAIAILSSTAAMAVPGAPTITWPTAGAVVQSNVPDITWTGDAYDSFEVHIGTTNDPNNPNGWDSGQVYTSGSDLSSAMSGYLSVQTTYYCFVRLHDANGWGGWSASGDHFYIDGQLLNDPYVIANSGLEWWDYIAYNPDRNEYCITWNNAYVTHWRRLDSTGAVIGSDMILYDDSWGHHFSTICYNSVRHEYLIEYCVWMGDSSCQVRVLRVDATTGNQIGSPIWLFSGGIISNTDGIPITYSPTSNSYLAVYESYSGGAIYGRILDATGNPIGSQFAISTPAQQFARTPTVAWNSTDNEFLVTYQCSYSGNGWDYVAQRVRASDGALLSNTDIETLHDCGNAGVAYDSNMNRYLVAYEAGGMQPWAQFISNTGTLVGNRFAVGTVYTTGGMASVAWNSSTREFLVTWADYSAPYYYGTCARRISQTGACIGEPIRVNGNETGIGNWDPIAVYNSVNNEYLIHWYNSYAKIEARRYKTFTPPPYAPGPITNFSAGSGNGVANLTWTNPLSSVYSGTMIRYRTDAYPTSATDGTLVIDRSGTAGANDSYTHTGRTNGVTYYYTAFAHDSTPLYSAGVNSWTIPTAPACFAETFSYSDGALNGNGGWSGSATSSQIAVSGQTIKLLGGSGSCDAIHTTTCGDPGQGFMWVDVKVKAGPATGQLWNLWINDTAGVNMARWYGWANTARGRIGGTGTVTANQNLTGGWDDLGVKINPYSKTSEFFFNGVSLGALDYSQTGAGTVIGAVRFERVDSGAFLNDYLYFDTLTIGQYGADTTPPTATIGTSSVGVTRNGPVSYTVNFSEPVLGFDSASDVQVNSTGTAAASSVSVTGSASGPYTVTLSGITGSGTVGITVKAAACADIVGNTNPASPPSATFAVLAADGSIAAAKQAANDSAVSLGNKVLYLKWSGVGYIEEPNRTSGIRVEGTISANQDDVVAITGTMKTSANGERYIQLTACGGASGGALKSVSMNNRSAKLSLASGLYIKTWGKVQTGSITANSYVLSDGSDASGIKVYTQGAPGVSTGQFVSVDGAAGYEGARVLYKK